MKKYDVVVVGAGPAGSVAARYAAEGGASVLILERDREPGIPVRCAEGVSHEGIKEFIDLDNRWILTKIEKAKLFAPDKNSVTMYNNGTGYVLERRLFDLALTKLAMKKGADLLTKANVINITRLNDKLMEVSYKYLGEVKKVKCNIVIGADGVESRVGRWAGLKTHIALEDIDSCVQYTLTNIETDAEACEFYFGNKIAPGGYIWVFPRSKTSANVGIGVAGHLTAANPPKKLLDQFVKERYPDAKRTYQVVGGVPTASTLKRITNDNVMLVGDAARQVNPITGGGIVQGMIAAGIAGKIAAKSITKSNYSKKFLKQYRKEWNKRLGKHQNLMYKMKDKFLNMEDEKFNNLVSHFAQISKDKFTTAALFKKAVKDDPKLVLELSKAFVVSRIKS